MGEARRNEDATARLEDELAVARSKLEEADQCRDEFLAMLSHELRNPLGAVTTAAALLTPLSAEQEKLLAILRRQSTRLARLLGELLEASRVTQRKIPMQRHDLDLRDVIDAAAAQLEPLYAERGIAIRVDAEDDALRVEGDAERLEQVLVNLLDNAGRYTESGGHVVLAARRERDRVVVRVADDGAGLTPEACEAVFDLFVQADRTLDRAAGGLGVGLSVVRAIVIQHGGEVRAESDGPGLGSCFVVELPCVRRTASGMREITPSSAGLPRDR